MTKRRTRKSRPKPSSTPADFCLNGWLKREPDFRVLYKYQRITPYALEALREGYLYFSSYQELNDPFDPFIELMVGRLEGSSKVVANTGVKIFCLTEDDNSPLMWAHYAGTSTGMCIGYAVFVGSPRIFHPVRYVDEIDGGSYSVLDLMTLKSTDWRWEMEWRACFPGELQKVPGIGHPVSICLGPRCSTEDMKRVRAAMPKTVTSFDIKFPVVKDSRFAYGTFDIDAVVEEYGGIPRPKDLGQGGRRSA